MQMQMRGLDYRRKDAVQRVSNARVPHNAQSGAAHTAKAMLLYRHGHAQCSSLVLATLPIRAGFFPVRFPSAAPLRRLRPPTVCCMCMYM